MRGETALIQTMGRAARNAGGTVLLYADRETKAMRTAIAETERRRTIQHAHNEEHGIVPQTIVKGLYAEMDEIYRFQDEEEKALAQWDTHQGRKKRSATELLADIETLRKQMMEHASKMEFEKAAELRDRMA